MRQPPQDRRILGRLAPLAFVAGVVLLGLSLLAVTFTATAPGHGPIESHETSVVDDTVVLAYPVPVSPYAATRIDVVFEFPSAPGTAMIVGCSGYSAILQGKEPDRVRTATTGTAGHISSGTAPDTFGDDDGPSQGCPFRYAVLQWPLQGETPATNRPDVQVTTSPIIMPGVVVAAMGVTALLGSALVIVGGTAWARRLQQERSRVPAGDDESTTETLLLLIKKTGDWLTRTRRYLILAGILGIFLWYPVVLPWAWKMAMSGSSGSIYPWLVTFGALALLVSLTFLWAREYLRLDRELAAWRDRMDRLEERETELLADLHASG